MRRHILNRRSSILTGVTLAIFGVLSAGWVMSDALAGNVFEKSNAESSTPASDSSKATLNDVSEKAQAMLRAIGANANSALDKADPNLGSLDLSKIPIDNWPVVKEEDLPQNVPDNVLNAKPGNVSQPSLDNNTLLGAGVSKDVLESLKGSGMSSNDEWACTCLLCLANPNGWRSVSECVPPVKKLFKHLKRHKMPKCPKSGAGNFLTFVYNPTNVCSIKGLDDVSGWIAKVGQRSDPIYSNAYQGAGTDYCVSGYQYTQTRCVEWDAEGECISRARVKFYSTVVPNEHYFPYAIDVTIEGKYWHRNHE